MYAGTLTAEPVVTSIGSHPIAVIVTMLLGWFLLFIINITVATNLYKCPGGRLSVELCNVGTFAHVLGCR
jgi:hypothetical protein